MKKKIIIIPDSFKGSMSSDRVTDILTDVAHEHTDCETIGIPIADGGEGSTTCILMTLKGVNRTLTVHSPENSLIEATYGITSKGTAVIEIAESSGITRQTSYKATEATTYGFGEMIRDALDVGIRDFLLCLGGSATTDAGCGMAAALGARFTDIEGKSFVPTGGTLSRVCDVDVSRLDPRIAESSFTVMSDVDNPLYGERGAAYVFGPQKGASETDVLEMDKGLRSFSRVMERCGFVRPDDIRGAGAAGGAGYGCVAFLGSRIVSGINAMLDICGFDELVKDASLIVTGEGKFDEQSLMGKVVYGIRERSKGIPMAVFCGVCTLDTKQLEGLDITAIEIGRGIELSEAMSNGEKYLREKAIEFFNVKENLQ